MNCQQRYTTSNNIIQLFLDIVSKEISQNKLIMESEYSSESDNSFLNQLCLKNQQDSTCESIEGQKRSIKQIEDFDLFDDKEECKMKTKQQQNIIKNILKSFLSYLKKLQDNNIKQKYQQMYNQQTNIQFSEIKKAVSKKVNVKANRWNFSLRSIVQSKGLKNIFYDYLINQSRQWLQQSKVSNQYDHLRLIDALLNCIENNYPLQIKTYKKKK
ncbi:hypothetical protein ABPG74_001593 [Tetrahymena malaccensis]